MFKRFKKKPLGPSIFEELIEELQPIVTENQVTGHITKKLMDFALYAATLEIQSKNKSLDFIQVTQIARHKLLCFTDSVIHEYFDTDNHDELIENTP